MAKSYRHQKLLRSYIGLIFKVSIINSKPLTKINIDRFTEGITNHESLNETMKRVKARHEIFIIKSLIFMYCNPTPAVGGAVGGAWGEGACLARGRRPHS